MAETEEEERDSECNANNVTIDTFIRPPVMTNTQRKFANFRNETQICLDILAETI